jgi:hypothetical protein
MYARPILIELKPRTSEMLIPQSSNGSIAYF